MKIEELTPISLELRHVEAHSIKSEVGLERSLKAALKAKSREGRAIRERPIFALLFLLCLHSLREKSGKGIILILFFLERKEPKENRRCANRSLLPAYCLRNGFQGTLNDTPSID